MPTLNPHSEAVNPLDTAHSASSARRSAATGLTTEQAARVIVAAFGEAVLAQLRQIRSEMNGGTA